MTTPAPSAIVTSSWDRILTPPQVAALMNSLISGAPFAGSLTRAETATGRIAFPSVGPSGAAWLRELEEVPRLVLDDRTTIVAVAAIKGWLPVSAEMQTDASVNITSWVSTALTGSLSRDVDLGLLSGSGEPEPDGIIDQADAVSGPTLIAATGAAMAAIGEQGGTADTIALSPTDYVAELTRVDSDGALVWPNGLGDGFLGLNIVQVPGLTPPLVYAASECFLVLGSDPQITVHDDWQHDAAVLLVKARANVGVPNADRGIRKLDLPAEPASAQAATATAHTGTQAAPARRTAGRT